MLLLVTDHIESKSDFLLISSNTYLWLTIIIFNLHDATNDFHFHRATLLSLDHGKYSSRCIKCPAQSSCNHFHALQRCLRKNYVFPTTQTRQGNFWQTCSL